MKPALISCVVPALNSAATLETTLLSLRAQRTELAVIVADSGSDDGTLEICRNWQVPVIYVPPGNMYRAINAGLRQCQTEWLAYLNSDDWIYPDSYARLISRGEQTKAAVVYGNCDYADAQGRFVYSFAAARPAEILPLFRLGRMGFAQQTAIFRRQAYEQLGGFDESFRFRADADFFLRAVQAGMSFEYLGGPPVACFRLHAQQFSNRSDEVTAAEAHRLFGTPELRPGLPDHLTLAHWRFRNLPHYLLRSLRESLLSGRLRFPRAIETYTHD